MGFENSQSFSKKREWQITTGLTSSFFTSSSHVKTILPAKDSSSQKPIINSHKRQKDNFSITLCMFFNARSIINKIFQLDALLHSQDFTFVFITETWLKPLYPDSFLVDGNLFCVLRCDRLYDRGGGVCVIYKKSLAPKIARIQIDAINCPGFEIIAFDFHFSKCKFSRYLCTYLPPSKINDGVTIKLC